VNESNAQAKILRLTPPPSTVILFWQGRAMELYAQEKSYV